jgi:Flp pilus assembly protein TadG
MKFMMKLKNQRGVAAVEFALVMPLLLVLLFGIIEFGFILYDKAMITNASREAARAGIVLNDLPGSGTLRITSTQLQDDVYNYLGIGQDSNGNPAGDGYLISFGSTISPPTITTTPSDPSNLPSGQDLTVTVTFPYDFLLIPSFITDITGTVTLQATTVMRAE